MRDFGYALANGTVAPDLLPEEIDYRPHLVEFGSELEQVLAIFMNVLDVNEHGTVTNHSAAQRRAAQWIRAYCDPSYDVSPPFEDWETELA